MPTKEAARCAQHGLVVAPDGLCVLCRRQAADAAAPEQPHVAPVSLPAEGRALGVIELAALLLMAAAGGAWGWRYVQGVLHPEGARARAAQTAEPRPLAAPATVDEQSALDKTKAADLAASLEMLAQAEAERRAREQQLLAQDEARRGAAEAARLAEEKQRDAARHAAVKRDLEQMGLEQARRNVQITMYSTGWCPVCKSARAYMTARGIAFTEFDIEQNDVARERAHAMNPRHTVPTITIDRELLVGFNAESFEERIARAARKRKQ